jgi:hypothetical protein
MYAAGFYTPPHGTLPSFLRHKLSVYSLFGPFGCVRPFPLQRIRPSGMLPSGPFRCLRAFSLPRGTTFGMAPISVLSVASEVSRFRVVLTLASLPSGPCPYSQPCPLQRGMDFRITPIFGPRSYLGACPLQRGTNFRIAPIRAFRFSPSFAASVQYKPWAFSQLGFI